jgi:zinc-ribbon domain
MHCTNCGSENQAGYKFCMRCGNPLTVEAPAELAQNYVAPVAPVNAPIYPPQRTAPQTMQPYGSQPLAPTGGSAFALMNIWGPFAGYGTRRRHVGWLMDGCADRAGELVQRIHVKFNDRQIPGSMIRSQILVARGVFVERRPYIILKKGLVSLALNVGEFGKDLFISLASYLKPPISYFRVLIASAMVVIWLFGTFVLPAMIFGSAQSMLSGFGGLFGGFNPNVGTAGAGSLFFMLCILGPVSVINNIALFIFFLYSLYKWFTEKDFLAGLRSAPNEFNEDDLMALEKSVEQTVRIALDEIGLNPNELKPVEGISRRII